MWQVNYSAFPKSWVARSIKNKPSVIFGDGYGGMLYDVPVVVFYHVVAKDKIRVKAKYRDFPPKLFDKKSYESLRFFIRGVNDFKKIHSSPEIFPVWKRSYLYQNFPLNTSTAYLKRCSSHNRKKGVFATLLLKIAGE